MEPPDSITYLTETEIDEGIKEGRFCRIRQFAESVEGERESSAYFKSQMNLISELERRVEEICGDAAFVSDNVGAAELLKIETGSNAITKKLNERVNPAEKFSAHQEGSTGAGLRTYSEVASCGRRRYARKSISRPTPCDSAAR